MPGVPDDVLPTAVRVWTARQTDGAASAASPTGAPQRKKRARRYPSEALVFDTETRSEASQQLLLGVWRFYRDDPDSAILGRTCVEEGFFYPDDLPDRDPDAWKNLQAYAASAVADVAPGHSPRLRLLPLSEWLEERLYRYGYQHRNRCAIVGFNLPFDFGAIASHWSPARKHFRGGWSLGLWGELDEHGGWHDRRYHPRLLLKAIDPRRTLFGWGSTTHSDAMESAEAPGRRGSQQRFIDLRTLVFALTDRSHTLESACAAFGDEFAKPEVTYGVIDQQMLHYARQDVRHTATLYRNCLDELEQHPGVDLVPQALYSPAGIGAAYLRAMNVDPPLEKFRDLDPRLLGWSMSAFYGGRAEARIVRTPVPVVVADFTSMYPAQNALLNIWPLLTAAALDADDVADDVRALLSAPDLTGRLFDPALWREQIGVTLVQLDHPDGVVLPVRAGYEPGGTDYGIGVNPLTYDGRLWYALPDVLAARLLSDAPIVIARALRLRPRGQQPGLAPVMLRGHRPVDPRDAANPFVAMIEERHRVKHSQVLPAPERARLDLFLKITANATAYGSLARFDRRDEPHPVPVLVYGPGDEPLQDTTRYPEDPGPYCFPPVAAAITAGARLMLALIERTVGVAGGVHAFMDTDSIAIVATDTGGDIACTTATGSSIRALPHAKVTEILRRFEPLNPYGPDVINDHPRLGRSPWKVEHDSLNEPVWCYAIATKRYALYTPTGHGAQLLHPSDAPEEAAADSDTGNTETDDFVDWSEHGLGMYLDPTPERARDAQGRRTWVSQGWDWILRAALTGTQPPLPRWADSFAVSQFSISTPAQIGWFRLPAEGTPGADKPRPFGFGLLAQVPALAAGTLEARPAAGFSRETQTWLHLAWYDRHTGRPITVACYPASGGDPHELSDMLVRGVTPLTTIGHVLQHYHGRPEHKSRNPDDTDTTSTTTGLLPRRPVRSAPVLTALIGKEGNRFLERAIGQITDPDDYRNTYRNGETVWQEVVVPILRDMREHLGAKALAADLGVSDRQVRNWLRAGNRPHAGPSGNLKRAEAQAVRWAINQLQLADRPVPSNPTATLFAYKLRSTTA